MVSPEDRKQIRIPPKDSLEMFKGLVNRFKLMTEQVYVNAYMQVKKS
jgi:hypothetical protein